MGGCFHSLIKTRYYDMHQTDTKELEDSFLTLNKRYQSTKYEEMLNNHSNIKIALDKKYFDKIITMRTNTLANRRVKEIGWKEYMINYLEKQEKEGIEWYSAIVEDLKNKTFLSENKYLSYIFFKEYEAYTKPKCLLSIRNIDYGDSNQNDYNEQIVEFTDLEDNVLNRLSSIRPDMGNQNSVHPITNNASLSRIDLTGVTENLGGSFFSNRSQSFSSNDPALSYKNVRNRIKHLVKIFKEHLMNKDHPITITLEIYEKQLSYVIGVKLNELKDMKAKKDPNYENTCQLLSEELVNHIQKFIIKVQAALKLFYSKAVDLQCFTEEKDELINLVTSQFFQTGKIYNKIYELFSLQINKQILYLDKKLQFIKNISPKDIGIPEKFSLDENTIEFQQSLKQKEIPKRKKTKEKSGTNDSIPLNGRITISSAKIELNQDFYEKNKKEGYNTVIKIIRGLKHNKIPFEKMLLIASISTEITECVNTFWAGMEDYISPSLLNINADELMAIFIFVVIKAQFPEILLHQKIVNDFTSRTTKSTMIGYYNTTLEAAIEYIQKEKIGNESFIQSLNSSINSKHNDIIIQTQSVNGVESKDSHQECLLNNQNNSE